MKPTFLRQDAGKANARVPAQEAGLPGRALIMTCDGEKRVADLRPGERIVTRDSGTAILREVTGRRIETRAVRIKAGSLGHNRPERDATLPAGQPVLLRDWRAQAIFGAPQVLAAAGRLADGEFVSVRDGVTMTVFDLEFDNPHVLYVDGLEVASFLADPAAHVTG